MFWYQYLCLGCLFVCVSACLWHFVRLVRLGKPKDLSKKSGNITKSVIYSNTLAMLPNQKESAYLHLPTFTAGVLFHIGTFIALSFFVVFFFLDIAVFQEYTTLLILATLTELFLVISMACGLILLLKRIFSKKLQALSSLDDSVSTFLTMLFQFVTIYYLLQGDSFAMKYYILTSIFFLYIPVGKLRHVVYFFAARYQLGFFYGWRNSWPPSPKKNVSLQKIN